MTQERKIALVTGASRGIGRSIVEKLAQNKNITVVGTATTEEGADNITKTFKEKNIEGKGLVLNLANSDSIEKFHKDLIKDYPSIDVLVNNAAITRDNLAIRMSIEDWKDVINVNLNSVFILTKLFLKGMFKKRWGRIVNISSIVAFTGNPGQLNYVASKSGLIGFTKSLASEVAKRNITVNAVAPGFIATDMTNKLSDELKDKILSKIPLGRIGSPEDISNAVAFLVSDKAGYISGETIHVNGGMYMS